MAIKVGYKKEEAPAKPQTKLDLKMIEKAKVKRTKRRIRNAWMAGK